MTLFYNSGVRLEKLGHVTQISYLRINNNHEWGQRECGMNQPISLGARIHIHRKTSVFIPRKNMVAIKVKSYSSDNA